MRSDRPQPALGANMAETRDNSIPKTGGRGNPAKCRERGTVPAPPICGRRSARQCCPHGPAGCTHGPCEVPAGGCRRSMAPAAAAARSGRRWSDRASGPPSPSSVSDGSASRPGSWPPANLTSGCDPRVHRGVGRKQVGKTLARVVDAHFHHRRGGARQFAAVLDLAQRRDHGVRILGQFHRAGIGQSSRERDSASRTTSDSARPARSAPPRE